MSAALQLFALANEKSSQKRLELLRRIADTFAVESEGSPAIQCLVDDIVTKLMGMIAHDDRASASSALAQMHHLPETTTRSLAFDSDVAVARPIIQGYRGLSNTILVDLASNGSQMHLEVIAGRDAIGPEVTDIVVERGDGQVVRTLAANQGAQFSRSGMRNMISKAEKDVRLQELLVDRGDLSLEAVGHLLPLVSQQLAARLRSPDLILNPTVVQEQVVSWASDRKKNVALINPSSASAMAPKSWTIF